MFPCFLVFREFYFRLGIYVFWRRSSEQLFVVFIVNKQLSLCIRIDSMDNNSKRRGGKVAVVYHCDSYSDWMAFSFRAAKYISAELSSIIIIR